jgi:hypothetical protein
MRASLHQPETAAADLQYMRLPFQPFLQAGGLAAIALGLTSCAERSERADIDDPVFGSSARLTYWIAPSSENVRIRDMAFTARVLRRYKTLNAEEREGVRAAVESRLRTIIAFEIRQISDEQRIKTQRLRWLPGSTPDRRSAAEREAEIRQAAVARVAQRLGRWVAVPQKYSGRSASVAFARIDGSEIEVPADAGEIGLPVRSLLEGATIRSMSGVNATLLRVPPVPVTSPSPLR